MTVQKYAHILVMRAIRKGKLTRPLQCTSCGNGHKRALQGHHEDYSKPLDVIWLCDPCHKRYHAAVKRQRERQALNEWLERLNRRKKEQ